MKSSHLMNIRNKIAKILDITNLKLQRKDWETLGSGHSGGMWSARRYYARMYYETLQNLNY